MNRRILILLTACQLLMPAIGSGQGLVWTSLETSADGTDTVGTTQTFYMPGMFRVRGSTGDADVIMRADRELIISIDHAAREYWHITFKELEALMKQVGGALADMRKTMKDLPP